MITVLSYVKYDAAYSSEDDEFDEAVVSEGILTVTENMNDAFDLIAKKQKEEPEELIDFMLNFWLNGEALAHAIVRAPIEDSKEEVVKYVKSFLH